MLKFLRKTCVTYYDEHVPESSVEILGHSAGGVTYRHYAHRAPLAFKAIMTIPQPSAFSALAIGVDGLGLISYFEGTNKNLKVIHCENAACTGVTLTTLDRGESVGRFTSVAIGADGLGLISYYDATNADLKVAHCQNAACTP